MRTKVLVAIGLIIAGGYFGPLFLSADDPSADPAPAASRAVDVPTFLDELAVKLFEKLEMLGLPSSNGDKSLSPEIELLKNALDTYRNGVGEIDSKGDVRSDRGGVGPRPLIITQLYSNILGRTNTPENRRLQVDRFYQNMIHNRADRVPGAPTTPYRRDMLVNQMYSDILNRDVLDARTQFVVVQTVIANSSDPSRPKIRVKDIVQFQSRVDLSSSGSTIKDIDFRNKSTLASRQDLLDAIKNGALPDVTAQDITLGSNSVDGDEKRNLDKQERRRPPPRTGVRPLGPRPPIRPPLMGTR